MRRLLPTAAVCVWLVLLKVGQVGAQFLPESSSSSSTWDAKQLADVYIAWEDAIFRRLETETLVTQFSGPWSGAGLNVTIHISKTQGRVNLTIDASCASPLPIDQLSGQAPPKWLHFVPVHNNSQQRTVRASWVMRSQDPLPFMAIRRGISFQAMPWQEFDIALLGCQSFQQQAPAWHPLRGCLRIHRTPKRSRNNLFESGFMSIYPQACGSVSHGTVFHFGMERHGHGHDTQSIPIFCGIDRTFVSYQVD